MNGFVITQYSITFESDNNTSVTLITSTRIIMNFKHSCTSDDNRHMCIARIYIPFDTVVCYKHNVCVYQVLISPSSINAFYLCPLIIHIIRMCRVILIAFTFLLNNLFPDTLLKLLSLRVLVAADLFARTVAICCARNMLFVAATSICAAFLSLYPTPVCPTLTTNDITQLWWCQVTMGKHRNRNTVHDIPSEPSDIGSFIGWGLLVCCFLQHDL